jgi:hypothetical protein
VKQGKLQLSPEGAKINGLILFAHSLDMDMSWRDEELWKAFLAKYHLPEIPLSTVMNIKSEDHHHYAGSPAMIAKVKEALAPAVVEALKRPEVGEP